MSINTNAKSSFSNQFVNLGLTNTLNAVAPSKHRVSAAVVLRKWGPGRKALAVEKISRLRSLHPFSVMRGMLKAWALKKCRNGTGSRHCCLSQLLKCESSCPFDLRINPAGPILSVGFVSIP